ncbi:FAD-binding oxidoreductase [Granulosicoccus sp.]|nr:FAD-binding oxidoreductase [Granulosicoccus sp.]MDB4223259.1 FAD-binding oxidoreductase [Granulosicoccus sp.]
MSTDHRFPIDGSRDALWMATAVPAPATKKLLGRGAHYDVAVIGGGFSGLNAALSLAKSGKKVCVLESAGLGFGASGRAGGQVNMGLNLGPDALIQRFGIEQGTRLVETITRVPDTVFNLIKEHQLDCDPVQTGWVQGAINSHFLGQQAQVQKEFDRNGFSMDLLDKEQIENMTGTDTFVGGTFNSRAGSLQPLSYTRELARVAIEQGADVFTHSPVKQFQQTQNGWQLSTDEGEVSSEQVLVCTNGYTGDLITGLAKKIVPVRSILIASEPLSDNLRNTILPNQVTLVDKRSLILYFRYDRDGRLCIGDHGPMRDAFTKSDFDNLKKRVLDVYPQLSNTRWDYHWGGRIAITKDSLPFIEQLAPGMWAGMGYNGRGVGMGTVVGQTLAELAMGQAPQESKFPVTEPKQFAMHRFHKVGVLMNIKWFELSDYLRRLQSD